MLVVDAHQDIAYNYTVYGRDYREGVYAKRRREASGKPWIATVGLPDALRGRVGVVFATLFAAPTGNKWMEVPDTERTYSTPREAYEIALQQMDYYQRLADEDERVRLLLTAADLDAVLETWQEGKEFDQHRQGMALLMEGADPIIEPKQFEEWYERGVRIVGLAWTATRYAGGTGAPGSLTDLGRELLDVLASFNVVLDLSHSAEQAFLEALDRYGGQSIIASHSNPRHFRDSDRHLSDDMIRRLAERDGVMGIVLYNRFLSNTWSKGDKRSSVPYTVAVEAIDYVCQLVGSAAHVGIGSDFDGGFGAESSPDGLDTVGDLWQIGAALLERGYDATAVDAIMGGNMLRKLRQVLAE